jgi:putative transposase
VDGAAVGAGLPRGHGSAIPGAGSGPDLRDRIQRTLEVLGVEEVVTAARSPWQNAYAERLIGSLRRWCLDHVVVLGEFNLLRILAGYFEYYNRARCHLSLVGDAPEPRPAQEPALGRVVELPAVGGLHHRYERTAA